MGVGYRLRSNSTKPDWGRVAPIFGVSLTLICAALYAFRVFYMPVTRALRIGPDSYSREIRTRITSKLRRDDLRYLLLSGKSGTGKSSVIQAGLIPKLEDVHGFQTLYVRLLDDPERCLLAKLATLASPWAERFEPSSLVLVAEDGAAS